MYEEENAARNEKLQTAFFSRGVHLDVDEDSHKISLSEMQKRFDFVFKGGTERGHGIRVGLDLLGGDGALKGKKVLDYGCGTGNLGIYLAMLGADVEGFDIVENRVLLASKVAASNNLTNVKFTTASARKLPYPDEYFDYVLGMAILHHVMDLPGAEQELWRVVKKGGTCIFHDSINDFFRGE